MPVLARPEWRSGLVCGEERLAAALVGRMLVLVKVVKCSVVYGSLQTFRREVLDCRADHQDGQFLKQVVGVVAANGVNPLFTLALSFMPLLPCDTIPALYII